MTMHPRPNDADQPAWAAPEQAGPPAPQQQAWPAPQQGDWQAPQQAGWQATQAGGQPVPPPAMQGAWQRPPTGAFAWWAMFLGCIPIPIVSGLVVIVAVVVSTVRNRDAGPLARANTRNALSWTITYMLTLIIAFALGILSLPPGGTNSGEDGLPILGLVASLLVLVAGITAIVHAIRGGLAAGRGEVYRAVGAIPFLR